MVDDRVEIVKFSYARRGFMVDCRICELLIAWCANRYKKGVRHVGSDFIGLNILTIGFHLFLIRNSLNGYD